MGQCLSATFKVLQAVNEASQQPPASQQQGHHNNQQQQQQQQGHHNNNQHEPTPEQENEPPHKPSSSTSSGWVPAKVKPHKQHAETETEPSTSTATLSSASQSTTTSPISYSSLPPDAEAVQVRNVYDGDTLTLTDQRRVRLLGIDAPEIKENQPFAQEAKDYTKGWCEKNQTIYLSYDGDKEDHYGRTLAHVYVQQQQGSYICVNEGIVAAGLAAAYRPSADKTTRNYDKLIALQAQARAAKLGIHNSKIAGNVDVDQIVVKTKNGTAYHVMSCEHIDPNWHLEKLKISEAQDRGLHGCRTCIS
jgi:endonuclease YncB( thermonuclease family)